MRHLCSSVVLLLPTLCWAQPRLDLHGNALPPNAVARCGTARDRPHTPLTTVALSPDGKLVAATDGNPVVWLWDAQTGKPLAPLKVARPMKHLHFSPDSKLLTVGDSSTVQLWHVARGELLSRITDLTDRCTTAFSADSRTVVLPRWREGVALHDVPSGKQRHFFPDTDTGEVAVLSPDGKQVALAREGGSISLLDVSSGKQLGLLDKHVKAIRALAYSRDGKMLLSLGDDGMLQLWDVPRRMEREARRVGRVLRAAWRLAPTTASFSPIWATPASAGSTRPPSKSWPSGKERPRSISPTCRSLPTAPGRRFGPSAHSSRCGSSIRRGVGK